MLRLAHLPFLLLAMAGLLAGLAAALARLGMVLSPGVASWSMLHGPLMVCAFLGTLIGLERAAALGWRWCYLAPMLSASGAAALLAGQPRAGAVLMLAASFALLAIFGAVLRRRERALHTVIMTAGAAAWFIGNGLWLLGRPMALVALWWVCFLVVTIAGERLELGRVMRPGAAVRGAFVALILVLGAAAAAVTAGAWIGAHAAGAALAGLAAWLARHDVARRTVRVPGLPRYMAVCMLAGYAWLATGGTLLAVHGLPGAGPVYDAIVHALLVGFVFSMIFAHALVILPAVLGVSLPFHPVIYAPLALLHVTLLLRVAGDLTGDALAPARLWGSAGNAAAVVLFFATVASLGLSARLRRR
ncbi:MAG: hypothetical protein IT495_20290 [Gammaproteobacteria bacterium]|nr:hypothetical protein [Gammaproteobacteria bacterium]